MAREFTEADRQRMEDAAVGAQNELMGMDDLDDETLHKLGNWWRENIAAGHKRLGRIILEFADKKRT